MPCTVLLLLRCVQTPAFMGCVRAALLRVHGHTPHAGSTLEDLARLARVQRAVVVQKLQKARRSPSRMEE